MKIPYYRAESFQVAEHMELLGRWCTTESGKLCAPSHKPLPMYLLICASVPFVVSFINIMNW